ncbi:MAG: hypothetical protein ACKO4A_17300 [Gammaproteobacteria bacterium]
MIHATRTALTLAICTALLLGCGGAPQRPEPVVKAPAPEEAKPPADPVDAILLRAERGSPERAAALRLDAAALLLERGESERAKGELESLQPELLGAPGRARRALLLARIALASGEPAAALALLRDPNLDAVASELPRGMQGELRHARALALGAG